MKQANVKAISECKKMRKDNVCPRGCSFWHTHARDRYPAFCKSALCGDRRTS